MSEVVSRRARYRADHIEDLLALLYPELRKPLGQCRVLDLGSGRGTLAVPTAKHVRAVVAVDTSASAIREGQVWAEQEGLDNVTFLQRSVLEVDEGLFDIVLCSDIVEHVPDQDGFVAMVAGSLDVGGAYYLSTNNRWWPLEGHYGLPFLSYLPRPWAERYFRIRHPSGAYDIYPLSLRQLTALLERHRLTWALKAPRTARTLVQRIGNRLVRIHPGFWHVVNAFQVVGTRQEGETR